MASIDSTQKPKLSDVDLEQIGAKISEVSALLYSIRQLAFLFPTVEDPTEADAVAAGLQALAEKAGSIADSCASKLGGGMVAGSFDDWARLSMPVAEAAAAAQVTG